MPQTTKKAVVCTFGCQMNQADSERIAGLLAAEGYAPHANVEDADLVVFNTCSVREHAADRLYGHLGALKPVKEARPELLIAVGGCQAQSDREEVLRRAPHVDVVFGTHNYSEIPRLIRQVELSRKPVVEIWEQPRALPTELPELRKERVRAWLPVSVGCDNFCSYCIVPNVRGREKSIGIRELVREAERLAGDGVVEITLLGQNVNSYGRDLYGAPAFPGLLRELCGVAGIKRIRFATSHPKDLTDELVEAVAGLEPVCGHIHLPLQAGSNRILKAMNRRYTQEWYLGRVEAIRRTIPEASITTDIIVGFPGETEEDFADTLRVMEEARFDAAYSFLYSPRKGTRAAIMEAIVPQEAKQERFRRLLEAQDKITLEASRRYVGRRVEVLVEEVSKKDARFLTGRTRAGKLVHFPGERSLLDKFVEVRISEARTWYLKGEAEFADQRGARP